MEESRAVNHRPDYRSVDHLQDVIDPVKAQAVIKRCVRYLSQFDFTTIACRGLSGLLIAPQIAARMGKTLLVIRKIECTGHGSMPVEGDHNAKSYVIVDDFIDSGKTVRTIMEQVEKYIGREARCIGVLQFYYFDHPDAASWFYYFDHPDAASWFYYFDHPDAASWFRYGSQVFNTEVVQRHQRYLDSEHQREEEECKKTREATEQRIQELRYGLPESVRDLDFASEKAQTGILDSWNTLFPTANTKLLPDLLAKC